MLDILKKTAVASAVSLALGAIVALPSGQAEAATIRIEDLSGGGAPDFFLADTGSLAQAGISQMMFGGLSVSVTVTPNEQPGLSFLNAISITTNGTGHIRITTSEDGFGAGARAPSASQLAFSVSATKLGSNGLSAVAYVDDGNNLETVSHQIGSSLFLAGPTSPPNTLVASTIGSAVLSAQFSMTSIFEIKHDTSTDFTSFDATSVAAVPLPAGGLLLIGALGGLAALRRRKNAA